MGNDESAGDKSQCLDLSISALDTAALISEQPPRICTAIMHRIDQVQLCLVYLDSSQDIKL